MSTSTETDITNMMEINDKKKSRKFSFLKFIFVKIDVYLLENMLKKKKRKLNDGHEMVLNHKKKIKKRKLEKDNEAEESKDEVNLPTTIDENKDDIKEEINGKQFLKFSHLITNIRVSPALCLIHTSNLLSFTQLNLEEIRT